jgi:DNA-binding transcriptional ArsR family regulator
MRRQQNAVDETSVISGTQASMAAMADVYKAVAHPVRAHILELLCRSESSIPQLCEDTGVKASHLSRHLTQMRSLRLIQCHRYEGRLVYQLAYPEVANLLAAAQSILHAQAGAAVAHVQHARPAYSRPLLAEGPVPPPASGALNQATFSEEQFKALETTLASRSVIADACAAIAARSGCTVDEAAQQLIITARNNNITLREAAARELRNGRPRT